MTVDLITVKKTNELLKKNMQIHYSQPKGFVGRSICYQVSCNDVVYGHIVGGSSTLHLPNRNEYFQIDKSKLNLIINNIFYHIEKVDDRYPGRWFTAKVLKAFREQIATDWLSKYGDDIIGFESLIELPRTGQCYLKDGWECIGQTKGYTCKRTAGKGTDEWSGKRVWDTENLRPKLVFVRRR